jgi:biopolymer transport protein ExbD
MRRPSTYARQSRALEVPMTPMIDVVFMLMIFFVWTSTFQIPEFILPSSLLNDLQGTGQPPEPDPEVLDLEQVVVRLLASEGQPVRWLINDAPVASLDVVRQRLLVLAAIRTDLPVIVDADDIVPLGSVIDVYDAARVAGFEQVQFAVAQ